MSKLNKGFLSVTGTASLTNINVFEKVSGTFGYVKLVITNDGVANHFDARVKGESAKMMKELSPGDQIIITQGKLSQGESAKNEKNFNVNVSVIDIVSFEVGRMTAQSIERSNASRSQPTPQQVPVQASRPAPQQAPRPAPQQVPVQSSAPAPQQAPVQASAPTPQYVPESIDFDDDIPF